MTDDELKEHERWAQRMAAGVWLEGSPAWRVWHLVKEVRELQVQLEKWREIARERRERT